MTAWCILLTPNRHTLGLADALNGNGFEAWAPAHHVRVRRARWNAPREIRQPLMPSFVFAAAGHASELEGYNLDIPFRLFRDCDGGVRLVADHQLEPLREAEANGHIVSRETYWRKGDKVLVTGGIFGGMHGIIERGHAETPTVRFGSRMRVKISATLLNQLNRCAMR